MIIETIIRIMLSIIVGIDTYIIIRDVKTIRNLKIKNQVLMTQKSILIDENNKLCEENKAFRERMAQNA